ncbi:MAG: cysteine synthase family protein [Gaiellales bacterium]
MTAASLPDPGALIAQGAGVLWAIGNTPLVDASMLLDPETKPAGVRLLVKLESSNPSGSTTDRTALTMLRQALELGRLSPGQRILEPSSGNTGISLAMLGRVLGHPVRIVMPENVTKEHSTLLRLFGAEVVHSPAELGSSGAVHTAQQLASEDRSLFLPMQYENPANPRAHYDGTGREILAQVEGKLGAFIAALGTGGTLMGVGRRLREQHPDVAVIAAELKQRDGAHERFRSSVLDATQLDRRILATNANTVACMRDLAKAGIFAGVSTAVALHAARRVAPQMEEGSAIVMIAADGGWRYLSAGLWDDRTSEQLDADMEAGHWW